jgi:transposase-like protein
MRSRWQDRINMYEPQSEEKVLRPAGCPFCKSRSVDTLAKTISVTTLWRCRTCEGTWTIQKLSMSRPRAL